MSAAANDVSRGGYRTSARAPTTPRAEHALGDGARELALVRQRMRERVFALALVAVCALVVALAVAVRGGSLALGATALAGWTAFVTACRATLRRARPECLEVRRGWVCAAPDGQTSFLGEDGATWRIRALPPCALGPATARVLPATRDVLALVASAYDAEQERAAAQRALDAHFHVTADDRDALARGVVPAHVRRRAWRSLARGLCAPAAIALASVALGSPSLVLVSLSVAVPLALTLALLQGDVRARAVARAAHECVGPVWVCRIRVIGDERRDQFVSVFAVGPVFLGAGPPDPLRPGDVVRVFYAFESPRRAHRQPPVAIELIARRGADPRRETDPTLDAFRARLH